MPSRERREFDSVLQWFSNLSGLQNHLGGFVKQRLLGPHGRLSALVGLGLTWEFAFLTSFQVRSMLLMWGLYWKSVQDLPVTRTKTRTKQKSLVCKWVRSVIYELKNSTGLGPHSSLCSNETTCRIMWHLQLSTYTQLVLKVKIIIKDNRTSNWLGLVLDVQPNINYLWEKWYCWKWHKMNKGLEACPTYCVFILIPLLISHIWTITVNHKAFLSGSFIKCEINSPIKCLVECIQFPIKETCLYGVMSSFHKTFPLCRNTLWLILK